MFFEQLANSGSYNRIIAVNRVGRPSHRMWRRQHQNRRLLRLKSAIFLLKCRLRLLGTARLRQRRKWVGWVRCQGMHEGFENDPGNRQECIQKLVEKSAGSAYIMRSTVIPMECHVVLSPCIRCVAKLSGCGAFYRLQQSLYQPKNLILSTDR